MSFKVKNTFKWNGKQLVWASGEVSDPKYNGFLDSSKKTTFDPGVGLIGKVWAEGGSKTVDVTTLGAAYLRLDAAKQCGLGKCTATKENDCVTEVFP